MSYDALLAPRDDEAPSGENLEYEQAFIDLELAATQKGEQQIGDDVLPSEEPDFRKVEQLALAVLEKSHDLRAAIHLAGARLQLGGLEGFSEVLDLIRGYIVDHWSTCHPQLDADDDDDPTMRVNAVAAISDHGTILRRLARAPITDSRAFGKLALKDIEDASGEDLGMLRAAFKDTDPDLLGARRAAMSTALAAVHAIDEKFDTEIPGRGPDLSALKSRLAAIVAQLNGGVDDEPAVAEDAEMTEETAPTGATRPAPRGGGGIRSTADVTAAIDQIVTFYQQTEPSSPVPIILERAKRLVNADFLTIIRDIAPDGVNNVRALGGMKDDESTD